MPYVARAEHARRESHERGEHDEDVIEIVNVEILSLAGPMEEQRKGNNEAGKCREHIDAGGETIARQYGEQLAVPAGMSRTAMTGSNVIVALRDSCRALADPRCRSARGSGTKRCRSR